MTEVELAALLGVKPPYLNAIASGKKNVSIRQLERIANALEMRHHITFDPPD